MTSLLNELSTLNPKPIYLINVLYGLTVYDQNLFRLNLDPLTLCHVCIGLTGLVKNCHLIPLHICQGRRLNYFKNYES